MEKLNNNKFKSIGKRIFGILIIPLICLVASLILTSASGTMLFKNATSFQIFLYGIVFYTLISFAVSINLHSGRFDFSIGSMLIVCSHTVIILARNGMHSIWLLGLISLAVGLACGLASGVLYVLLKLPPMILSLGMALIFESIAYILTNGKSLSVTTGDTESANILSEFVGNTGNYLPLILIFVIVVGLLVVLFNYTKFGNDYHALQFGQKIAVNTGINETSNAILCYVICGGIVGIAGWIYAATIQTTRPDGILNFGSIAVMFNAFCSLFFADYIRRYLPKEAAISIGVISYQFLQLAFGNVSSINSNFTSKIYGIINSLILVLFLIYLNNEKTIKDFIKYKIFRKKKENFNNETVGGK